MSKKVPLHLNDADEEILETFQCLLDANASDVLRWALRFYALNGPMPLEARAKLAITIPPGHHLPTWEPERKAVP